MKKIGSITVIAKNGNLLVKTNKPFRIGSKVVNQEIKNVGKIVDIIGPAKTPYIVINTKGANTTTKEGEMLYLLEKTQNQTKGPKKSSKPPPRKYHKTSKKK